MAIGSESSLGVINFGPANQPQQNLVAISPTLVIGLGGSGKAVAMRLRRMFYERYGEPAFPW